MAESKGTHLRPRAVPIAFLVEKVKSLNNTTSVLFCTSKNGSTRGKQLPDETRCLVHVLSTACATADNKESLPGNEISLDKFLQNVVVSNATSRWATLPPPFRIVVLQIDIQGIGTRNRRGDVVIDTSSVHGILACGLPESEWSRSDVIAQQVATFGANDENNDQDAVSYEDDPIQLKRERHHVFAQWLVKEYGVELLRTGSGVLDVAGGNGMLSVALVELGVPCTLLDPHPRLPDQGKAIYNVKVIPYALNGDGSDLTERMDEISTHIMAASVIVGLHPDQATEPIVDLALRLRKCFAIVPCCVMPKFFPDRVQKKHADPVRSYSAFIQYLMDKVADFSVHPFAAHQCQLAFVGRNKVIYTQP